MRADVSPKSLVASFDADLRQKMKAEWVSVASSDGKALGLSDSDQADGGDTTDIGHVDGRALDLLRAAGYYFYGRSCLVYSRYLSSATLGSTRSTNQISDPDPA